jgi:hypothetical protein
MIAYLIKFRPFKSELQQVICVSDEFTTIFGMCVLYAMYYQQGDPVTNKKLGMVMIGVICVSIIKNISIIAIITTKSTYIRIRSWMHKKFDHQERKKKRLQQERKKKQQKEEEIKADNELLKYGIIIDPTEMGIGQQMDGKSNM